MKTTSMVIFMCCTPKTMECYASELTGPDGASQHARERAQVTGLRQRVVWRPDYGLWMIVTILELIKPSTWKFDGRTYAIVDAQS